MPPRGRASSTVVPSVVGPEAVRLVAAQAGPLTALALGRMEEDLEWYPRLSAEDRSWIGLVAQAGVGAFVRWLRRDADTAGPTDRYGRPRNPITVDVFGTAPRELTWSISLGQALDLVRLVVDVVEEGVLDLAPPADREAMREAVLRYSREVAFAAAQVYAEAAEARGAWDARLEALVVDAVVRGEADDSMQSRATALGWGSVSRVTVVAGSTPPGSSAAAVDTIHRAAAEADAQALAAVQRRRFVVVLGGTRDALATVTALSAHFGPGPIVVGPDRAAPVRGGTICPGRAVRTGRLPRVAAGTPPRGRRRTATRACTGRRRGGQAGARGPDLPAAAGQRVAAVDGLDVRRGRRRPWKPQRARCSCTPTRFATGSGGSRR